MSWKGSLIIFLFGIMIGWFFGSALCSTSTVSSLILMTVPVIGGLALAIKGRKDKKKACSIDPTLCD